MIQRLAYWEDTLKIIVFGIGEIYRKVKHYFYEANDEIVALVDNSQKLVGTQKEGYVIDFPENIQHYTYDYIVITSDYAAEMKRQLIELGIRSKQIIHFRDYIGNFHVEIPAAQMSVPAGSVLILSNEFGYHGGPIVCVNLARVLRHKGYMITIAVPSAEQEFLEEISLEEGIQVIVVENLSFLSIKNLGWISKYTYVLANTFVTARCAIKLAQRRKVYLWLHESIDSYAGNEFWYDEIMEGIKNERLIIGAVSDVARKNFYSIYPVEKKIEIFPYGIDDRYKEDRGCVEDGIITFGAVANHALLKGLDVLLDAFIFISEEKRKKCRFLFVGKTYDSDYGRQIRNKIDQNANCEYLGELSREDMFDFYSKTDVIIIPSRRDSLPLVATEAMMLKKPCVISDAIGTTRYVKHKYNGLVFQSENCEELADMILWCLENGEGLKLIAENARKTYEAWFTMEKFGERVIDVFQSLR